VVSFTPLPLYPQGKIPWYPLDRRLGGPQSLSGRGGEEKQLITFYVFHIHNMKVGDLSKKKKSRNLKNGYKAYRI